MNGVGHCLNSEIEHGFCPHNRRNNLFFRIYQEAISFRLVDTSNGYESPTAELLAFF